MIGMTLWAARVRRPDPQHRCQHRLRVHAVPVNRRPGTRPRARPPS